MDEAVFFEQAVAESILSYARMLHPREAMLLLKGKVDKERIVVHDTLIPPLATHGNTFSTFKPYMLPIDFSIIGIAHSHPSGAIRPSLTDLNHFYGRIMVIAAYPYRSEKNMAVFDREGKPLRYEVVKI